MFDTIQHNQLAYPLPVGGSKVGIPDQKAFTKVLRENEIHTFVVNGKRFVAAFELDRLILKLMRQEAQREFLADSTEKHGTGVQTNA